MGIGVPFTRRMLIKSDLLHPFTESPVMGMGIGVPFTRRMLIKSDLLHPFTESPVDGHWCPVYTSYVDKVGSLASVHRVSCRWALVSRVYTSYVDKVGSGAVSRELFEALGQRRFLRP
ncbi:hypothetical protein TNCV_4406131 [Trichonephila clavipes]|nr:hypothetical protein TNCV_4406131 [Trichonephila clavipes]